MSESKTITYNDESLSNYLLKVEQYKMDINKKKYDIILNFVNDMLELDGKLKSLTNFKYIKEADIIGDLERNKEIIKKYKKDIHDNFKIELKYKNMEKNPMYIINNLRKILKNINYKLCSKKVSDGRIYFIRYTRF